MTKKKVKRRPKKKVIVIFVLLVLVIGGFITYKCLKTDENVEEIKVVSKIDDYGYSLKENKSKKYKALFSKLKDTLSKKNVDEKEYAKLITKMFIIDFYSLGDRTAKTDVGGVDFVHEQALENFILNAEDTIYKYVESNVYSQRKQELPIVDKVKIKGVNNDEFAYLEAVDENAFIVEASWTYEDETIGEDYQNSGTFTFVHDGKKLCLVELSE